MNASEPSPSIFWRLRARIRIWLPWIKDIEPQPGPGPKPSAEDLDRERIKVQIDVVRRAMGRDAIGVAHSENGVARDDAEMTYLYRRGYALVREDRFEDVNAFFERRVDDFNGGFTREGSPVDGLVLAAMPTRKDEQDEVLATLRELDDEIGRGAATPDHVVYVVGYGRICPATEPLETRSTAPVPPVSPDDTAGADVRVAVVDTGWWKDAGISKATPWLSGVVADPADEETVNQAAIHEYAGHGTFVAGVVRCMAPSARVEIEGFLPKGGAVYESQICQQLDEALTDDDKPQIISISAGTHTRWSLPLLGFEMLAAARKLIDPQSKVLIVAAAGNDSSSDKFYPAAFDWVVGVGSVDADGKVSDYSNTGEWVKVFARGRDLVNAFPVGTYTCYEPDNIHSGVPDVRHFRGLAQWSGTSFSTPIVSGAIAAQMTAMGTDDPRAAYDALVKAAPQCADPKAGGSKLIGPL